MVKKFRENLKEIVFITNDFPTAEYPVNTFVEQLISEISRQGIDCTVIAPQSITTNFLRKKKKRPYKTVHEKDGNKINVYRPNTVSFSNHFQKMNRILFTNSVKRILKKLDFKPNILYGHFVLPSGFAAVTLGEKYNIPSFIAMGESSLENIFSIDNKEVKKIFSKCAGIISVSSSIKRILVDKEVIEEEKIFVSPNAVDTSLFKPYDKNKMREKYNFKNEDFIIGFIGHFNHRKGSKRLSNAIKQTSNVKSVFIGTGNEQPDCKNIIFMGKASHNKIPELLSTCDVFVLPTLAEGSCNAIIEATACGLPIISSDRAFNDDILFEDNSIKIDPMEISEIKNAIERLQHNPKLKKQYSEASIYHREKFQINKRANNILNFISCRI